MGIQRRFSGWCAIALVVNLVLVAPALAAQVTLSLAKSAAPAAQTVKIPINAEVTAAAAAMQMDLLFDPGVLTFKQIENGPLLTSALVEANVGAPGQLRIALTSNEEIKGTGTLLNVEFEVQPGAPAAVALRLDNARAWDQANNLEMTVAAGGGEFSRTGPSMLLWAFVAAGAVLLIALGFLVVRRRKGTQQPAEAPRERKAGKFCPECGTQVSENAKFCKSCGARL
jgi:LPXTG-motif cell wall-anchored protein